MPITPTECKEHFSQEDEKRYNEVVKQLDAKLLSTYYGQGIVNFTINGHINQRVQTKLRTEYRKAGWHYLSFQPRSNQRDGSHTEIAIGETTPPSYDPRDR